MRSRFVSWISVCHQNSGDNSDAIQSTTSTVTDLSSDIGLESPDDLTTQLPHEQVEPMLSVLTSSNSSPQS